MLNLWVLFERYYGWIRMIYLSSYTEGEDIHHLHSAHTTSRLIWYHSVHFYSHRVVGFDQPHSPQFDALKLHSSHLWASIATLLGPSFLQIDIKGFAGKVLWPCFTTDQSTLVFFHLVRMPLIDSRIYDRSPNWEWLIL